MPTIVAISGSLRAKSYNTMLLRAAVAAAPAGTSFDVASIRDIPLYDGDAEAATGSPPAVAELKAKIAAADGLLLVTPEYNGSIPGVLKNVIDWLSRPPADIAHVFGGKPAGVIGATPGPGGTTLSQAAWLPVLRALGTLPYFGGRLGVSGAGKVFDEQGQVVDEKVRAQIEKYVAGFAQFVASNRRA
jgi:NAD(P)H-dependent FMN reductase